MLKKYLIEVLGAIMVLGMVTMTLLVMDNNMPYTGIIEIPIYIMGMVYVSKLTCIVICFLYDYQKVMGKN